MGLPQLALKWMDGGGQRTLHFVLEDLLLWEGPLRIQRQESTGYIWKTEGSRSLSPSSTTSYAMIVLARVISVVPISSELLSSISFCRLCHIREEKAGFHVVCRRVYEIFNPRELSEHCFAIRNPTVITLLDTPAAFGLVDKSALCIVCWGVVYLRSVSILK